jgi:protein transport protein DSL1/ZW10
MTIARGFMSRDYRNSVKVTAATERCNIDASLGSGKKDGSSGKGKLGVGGSGGGGSVGASSGDEVESGSFQMPDYRITHCAHDVVELAHQTLMEACTPDAVYANTFFHTSRDILFLFRAVVPTLYASEIANDASTCMLFHNDCMYIAYHMLTIGHLYKNR